MGNRFQRCPVHYEEGQSGCMWGLISILNFRHGRTTRKLLSDRRCGSQNAVGAGCSRNKFDMLTHFDEDSHGTYDGEESTITTADSGKPSVKKLIEEEMISEQDPKKEISNVEEEQKQSENGGHIRKNRKRTKKTGKKSCDIHTHGSNAAGDLGSECSCHHNSEQQSMGSLDIDAIMEEFCSQIHHRSISCVKHDHQGEVHMQLNQKHSEFEEKFIEAIKMFLDQKYINGNLLAEVGKIHVSKEVLDTLQILSSEEEEFLLKLLQDPNSLLKYVQNMQDAQTVEKDQKSKLLAGSNSSEQSLSNLSQSEELVNCKRHKFFRRKVKSKERNQSVGNENSQASNRIVILKPELTGLPNSENESSLGTSPESHYVISSKGARERIGSHYFLTEIKRKLKHAMGKEQRGISPDGILNKFPYASKNLGDCDKVVGGDNVGRNSPSKDHLYIERIARPSIGVKRGDKTGKQKDSEISLEQETTDYPKQRVSNIYIEAKKHLSEMLSNGDEAVDFPSRQVPKTLGRILSLSEYNFSPVGSPGRDWEPSFLTAQMRFSVNDKNRKVNENTWSPKQENNDSRVGEAIQNLENWSCISDDNSDNKGQALNSNPNISYELIDDSEVDGTFPSIRDEINSDGATEIIKSTDIVVQEESNVLVAPSELSDSSLASDYQNGDTSEVCDEERHSERLKQASCEENQSPFSPLASPSSSLVTRKVQDVVSTIYIPEQPSPVSVLDPFFTEDDISPASTRSLPVKLPLQPLQIQFEDHDSSSAEQGIHTRTCMQDKETIFEYIKAVLQASGLNWDEFYMKSLSSDQLLDPSLYDAVEFFSNQLCNDQKLLFDCINEVLINFCWRYFGFFSWASFVKPNIRPLPKMKNAIREVWEGVYWHLLPQPLPHSLDQIVRKVMAKSGTWMDLRFDTESIGVDFGETILDELMEDMILSCVNEGLEYGYSVLSGELKEDESSINLE